MSAHENRLGPYSVPAGADLTGSQYCGVVINNLGKAVLPAAGAFIDGVLQNPDATNAGVGTQARLDWMGIQPVVYGGPVTVGDLLSVDGTGKFVTSVTSGHNRIARALFTGVSGDRQAAKLGSYGTVP